MLMLMLDIAQPILASDLDKQQRSQLLYLETCAVDYDGFVEGNLRMNAEDHVACELFKANGLIEFGRVPAKMLNTFHRQVTHYVTMTDAGWALAAELRRKRAADGLAGKRRRELAALKD